MGSNLSVLATPYPGALAQPGQQKDFLLARSRLKKLIVNHWSLRAPKNRTVGASRGNCLANTQPITALLPVQNSNLNKKSRNSRDNIWLTDAAYPKVLFNLPENSIKQAQFWVENPKNAKKVVYSAVFELPEPKTVNGNQQAGVVILNLAEVAKSANLPELAVGEKYLWTVRLLCDSNATELSASPTITGWMQRIDPKIPLGNQLDASASKVNKNVVIADELQKVEPIDYASIYAINGIWYSTVSSLADLYQSNPGDPEIINAWEMLLAENGLPEIAKTPIVGSATITKVNLGSLPD